MDFEKLSKTVFPLNTDLTEDYAYFQIISHLAQYGSFTITQLDRKIIFEKEKPSRKKHYIERRKLKKILWGTDKNYRGLIPLNYVMAIPAFKNRGGYQEIVYYLTEKGIMASLGYSTYKQNINIKKILKSFEYTSMKPYKKFITEFIQLQIQVFLLYHITQGITLSFKYEHVADYDLFRSIIVKQFDIRAPNNTAEEELQKLLRKFNIYRMIHRNLVSDNEMLSFVWNEPHGKEIPDYGFHGWYHIESLTRLNENLTLEKYTKQKPFKRRGTPMPVSEFIYARFQDNSDDISQQNIEHAMKLLSLKSKKSRTNSLV